jgi:hypothetical protein
MDQVQAGEEPLYLFPAAEHRWRAGRPVRITDRGHDRRDSDSVEIDAGPLTGIIAALAIWIFRYRQRRWHKLVRNHLLPGGPRYAADPQQEPA